MHFLGIEYWPTVVILVFAVLIGCPGVDPWVDPGWVCVPPPRGALDLHNTICQIFRCIHPQSIIPRRTKSAPGVLSDYTMQFVDQMNRQIYHIYVLRLLIRSTQANISNILNAINSDVSVVYQILRPKF